MFKIPRNVSVSHVAYTTGSDTWQMEARRYRYTFPYLVGNITEIAGITYLCANREHEELVLTLVSSSFEDWQLIVNVASEEFKFKLEYIVYVTERRRFHETNLRSSFNILHWHTHDLEEIHYKCVSPEGAIDVVIRADSMEEWSVHVTTRKRKPREKTAASSADVTE